MSTRPNRPLLRSVIATWYVLGCAGLCFAQKVTVSADHPDGVYKVGETVHFTVQWKAAEPAPSQAKYVLKRNGLKEEGGGELPFKDGRANVDSKFDEPGAILIEVSWPPNDNTSKAFGGAVADAQQIKPAAAAPDDFDAFWKSKIEELQDVPPNPKLEPGDAGKPGVGYWKITMDNIRGTHIRGQLARPENGEKFPALLVVQYAGVYPLQKPWAVDRAADGWLTLNILAHDLPIDEPADFYKQQFDGPLKNYWAIGNDDRDTSYYLRMYLSCYRAVEYLKSRTDWDGKTLVVMGTSQGGQQALVTGGLQARSVTAVLAFLPAACDFLAPGIGRAAGFPNWYTQVNGKDAVKVRRAANYYDPVHFAARIKCPVLIGVALHDDLAPPSSVFAAANQVTSPKEVVVLPNAGHQDENGSQRAYNDRCYGGWLPALRDGKPAPPPPARASANAGASEADHRRMLDLLKIDHLRRGADGDPNSPFAANSDEGKADVYGALPDPLKMNNGGPVTSAKVWWNKRRPELVELFDREIYGRVPKDVPKVKWECVETKEEMQNGTAVVSKQLVGHVDNAACPSIQVDIKLSVTTPAKPERPVPIVMEFGFGNFGRFGARAGRAMEPGPSWQEQVLKRGWGYATLVPTTVQADSGAGLNAGIIGLTNRGEPRKPDDWGALRAWAWGASRAVDYFESDGAIDARHVAICGLSRYGKAALVTMAYDSRFAVALVGSSGAGGAKLFRRDFGEKVENLASSGEYHWFCGNFIKYAGPLTPADLPVDAHELIALCAPRPVFIGVGSPAVEGNWVDGKGTFLAAVAAGPVYRLLGKKDLRVSEMPPTETPLVAGELAFRQHASGHTNGPNWPTFLDYASRYFAAEPTNKPVSRADDPTWAAKHEELVARAKQGGIDLYFLGDSITRRWEATHNDNWRQNFAAWKAADFGAGGDRTQNVLYRIENGELAGVNPKVIVLLIGTNNVGFHAPPGSDETLVSDVVSGIEACVSAARKQAPNAKVLLMGITTRNTDGSTELMPTIGRINQRIARLADGKQVRFLDINGKLTDSSGKLLDGVTEDGLHLSNQGYQIWADAMKPMLTDWLGAPAKGDAAETVSSTRK